jgi:hypothetical protein
MLQSRIDATEAEIRTLEKAISELNSCAHVLSDPAAVIPSDLRPMMDRLRALLRDEAELERADDVRMIVGGFNRHERNAQEGCRPLGAEAQALSPLLSRLLSEDDAEARSRIADVLKAERGAAELMERLHAIARLKAVISPKADP